jgi:pre-mRNA-splicing factor SYF1
MLHERALQQLPGSYKLWHQYLEERTRAVRHKCVTHDAWQVLINTYERALVHMHKMPRIWTEYCEVLVETKRCTETRHLFDRALQALPLTQHGRIWTLYITFVKGMGVWETATRVFRRYLKFDPGHREEYLDYLLDAGQRGEGIEQLAIIVNDDKVIFLPPSLPPPRPSFLDFPSFLHSFLP